MRRVSFRLSDADVAQLIADYQAGSTGRQLAERYGLARSTVLSLLHEHGVVVRHPRVSPSDCARAVALFREGVSQKDIAAQLGRSPSVIWHVVRRAGELGS